MAVNHVFSGRWERCMISPAVTEVCLPQAAHSRVKRQRFSARLRVPNVSSPKAPFEDSPVSRAGARRSGGRAPRRPKRPTRPPRRTERGRLVVTLAEIALIHDLKRQGPSISAIARKTGLDRKTMRRHLGRGL